MITKKVSYSLPIRHTAVSGCVVKSSYNIPREKVDANFASHFILRPKASGDHIVLPYPIYSETESWLRIPRGAGIAMFGLPQDNRMVKGEPMHAIFQGKLRPYQTKACQLTTQTLNKHHGALLLACCGAGKTIMAIYLACTFGVRVGIVVHKEFLLTQWKERIAAFCPDATIGIVQQNRCDIGCDFTLFMLHSTISRAYDPAVFSQIGLVVVDECHHISAKYFSQIMQKFPAEFRLGLTATPDRADGLGFALNYFFGPTACQIQRETAVGQQATVHRCFYKEGKQTAITMSNGKLLYAKMITRLVEDEKRNDFVVSQILEQVKHGKCILVASERRKHLQDLAALLPASILHAFYVGETSKKRKREREENKEDCDVLFTTYQMASEGLDIKRLNCLIMATPKKNIEQVVGRILRKKDGKPVVVDMVDNFSVFAGLAKSRMRFYKAKDFEVVTSKDGREHSPSPTAQGRSGAAIKESLLPFLQGKERADQ
jgi:superfamily II DNA or RNA helicase